MFKRQLVNSIRPVSRRSYATAPSSSSGSNGLIFAIGAAVIGGGAYYYYNTPKGDLGVSRTSASGGAPMSALNKDEWTSFKLKESHDVNHNTKHFTFELPDKHVIGLSIASALMTRFPGPDGKPIIRPYTPTSDEDSIGHVDFLIKKYKDGKMSEHMHAMKPGDELEMKGPIPKFKWEPNQFEEIAMIAGGSGITPMYQLTRAVTKNPADKTKLHLIYSNVTEEDILLRQEFDKLAKANPEQVQVHYVLDKAPKDWPKDSVGYISDELIKKWAPGPEKGNKIKVFVCGPPGQVAAIAGAKGDKGSQGELKGALSKAGYKAEQVFKF